MSLRSLQLSRPDPTMSATWTGLGWTVDPTKLWAGLGELHRLAEPTLEELASASVFGGPCRPVATVPRQESRLLNELRLHRAKQFKQSVEKTRNSAYHVEMRTPGDIQRSRSKGRSLSNVGQRITESTFADTPERYRRLSAPLPSLPHLSCRRLLHEDVPTPASPGAG